MSRGQPRRPITPGSTGLIRFGLGSDVPYATGNANEALLALVDGTVRDLARPLSDGVLSPRAWTGGSTIRMRAGKDRGLWTTYGTRTPFHLEGGKGTTSKVVHLQLRPIL